MQISGSTNLPMPLAHVAATKEKKLKVQCCEAVPVYDQAIGLAKGDRPHYLHERASLSGAGLVHKPNIFTPVIVRW